MPYTPLHERLGSLPRGPDYAPPDTDPSAPLTMSESPRPAKRRREDEDDAAHASSSSRSGAERATAGQPSRANGGRYQPAPPPPLISMDTAIAPSIFGIAPRNEFTKAVGEFIMAHCRGVADVEIEIKLGTLHAGEAAGPPRRMRLPTMTELILPPDYPKGNFASTMTQKQHASLNRLLNQTVQSTHGTPLPLYYQRVQQVDSFYNARGGRVRVSRDRAGNTTAVIRKRRLGDLNVVSPREAFDWRISVNVEEECEMPDGEALSVRDKDRMCYEHQLCQVDLTVVTAKDRNLAPGQRGAVSYELEIEVRDVASLVEEGEKEMAGMPSRFDEMLQSVLDTARMLIRNVDG